MTVLEVKYVRMEEPAKMESTFCHVTAKKGSLETDVKQMLMTVIQ